MRPTKSGNGLQRSPGTPEAPQKPKKQFLAVRKPSLGALRGPPWRSSGGAQIVLFDMNGLHWPPKWRIENQTIYRIFFMKICKKHCFYYAKQLSTRSPETPREGHKSTLRLPNAVIWYESSTFDTPKNKMKNRRQKEKNKNEKVKFARLSSDTRPKAGLLGKMVPETW